VRVDLALGWPHRNVSIHRDHLPITKHPYGFHFSLLSQSQNSDERSTGQRDDYPERHKSGD
ncbi:MAG: hypothetical protein ACR2P3_14870, partial [Geminicoccaceae bacterium]